MAYGSDYLALLHFDGADASTTFTDEIGNTWTASGHAQIDTAQKVFGTASGLFDGNNDDFISVPDDDKWVFGNSFTMDLRVRWAAVPASGETDFFWYQTVDANNYTYFAIYNNGAAQRLQYIQYIGGAYQIANVTSVTIAINTWYHFAVVRSGSNWYFFQDGTQVGTTTSNATASANLAADPRIGFSVNGWIDEFRIRNRAVWTADFTIPAAAYGEDTFAPSASASVAASARGGVGITIPPSVSTAKAASVAPTLKITIPPTAASAKAATSGGTFVLPTQIHAPYRDFNVVGQERDYSLSAQYRSFNVTAPEL